MTSRRLAAILAADVAGFSAMMERDEEGTFVRVQMLRQEVIEPSIQAHYGRLVKTTGDGFLAEFASPVEAVRCALTVQAEIAARERNNEHAIALRIGINLGDVIVEGDGDIYGDGVNVAARLEQIASPGGVCISGAVHDQIEGKLDRAFESRGEQHVKNIARPIRVYAVAGVAPGGRPDQPKASRAVDKDKPSITVLPFTNLSGDPEQEYFVEGLRDDIVAALLSFSGLVVLSISSRSAQRQAENAVLRPGAAYLLEGSVRRAGNWARVSAQLRSPSGESLWAEKYDFELGDVFAVQDKLAQSIPAALKIKLEDHERRHALAEPTANLDAYDYYLRGQHLERSFDRSERARASPTFSTGGTSDGKDQQNQCWRGEGLHYMACSR
jgi:adenylate cyclase